MPRSFLVQDGESYGPTNQEGIICSQRGRLGMVNGLANLP